MDKDITSVLGEIDKLNPYSSFLDEETLSSTGGWFDTGSMVLNGIISGSLFGGVPKNRMTLFAGPSMAGKSYIVQRILANAQKEGYTVVIFDSENAIDRKGAEALGLDVSKVKYVPVFSIEECRNAIYKFLTVAKEKGLTDKFIIAIDSLGNMESEIQINRMEKDNTSTDMGSRARAMKTLLRTCVQLSGLTQTTILATNHVYEDPSAMFPSLEKLMPGGKAVVYLPSVTVQLARKPIKEGKDNTDGKLTTGQKNFPGVILRALTVKNRFVQQYLEGEMYLSFASGLDKYYGLLALAKGLGVVEQSGATYTIDGEKLGYFGTWKNNTKLWDERIVPRIEERIAVEWKYGSKEHNETPDEDEQED
jgi:RecA/RadA recombinase